LATLVLGLAWCSGQRRLALRSEAVARACHELRGPLTAARLGLDLGTRGHPLSAAHIRAIGSELGRAALAVDDLAHPDRAQPAAGEAAWVDLRSLLTDSVNAWRASAQAAGVELQFRDTAAAVLVRGQHLRLAQAAGNLIANAIEHGGGTVTVGVSVAQPWAQITVRDDGPGLPDSVPALTQRARRGAGARGRGLAIVTGIAAVHGGRLRALTVDRGTHLALELPVADPPGR
jgi:signal transduction histidine kinase